WHKRNSHGPSLCPWTRWSGHARPWGSRPRAARRPATGQNASSDSPEGKLPHDTTPFGTGPGRYLSVLFVLLTVVLPGQSGHCFASQNMGLGRQLHETSQLYPGGRLWRARFGSSRGPARCENLVQLVAQAGTADALEGAEQAHLAAERDPGCPQGQDGLGAAYRP